ncbi:hypothetical protein SRABI106_04638 [Rahnella aquatilis]|nr:hypothetical protein SRABI106_04638 [Rahnella aquatilis]
MMFIPEKPDVLKLKDHRQFLPRFGAVKQCIFRRCTPRLTNGYAAVRAKGGAVHLMKIKMQIFTVRHDLLIDVFADQVNNIHSEPADTTRQPAVHHRVDGGTYVGIFPVEIRLAR